MSGSGYVRMSITGSLDILCQFCFAFVLIRKIRRTKSDKHDKVHHVCNAIFLLVSLIDTIFCMILTKHGFITCFLRPFIVTLTFKQLQSTFTLILLNIKDSSVTLIVIFTFVLYFAFFANFIFYATFEGVSITPRLSESYWQFIVLLTTENYPDILLLSY